MRVKAIIWDYDGTLIDTRRKNLNVNRRIVAEVSQKSLKEFPALASLENYDEANIRAKNWQTFYEIECGFTPAERDRAGSLWTKYQRLDSTGTILFKGLRKTLNELTHVPHSIVSQNSRQNISENLNGFGA